jgi:type IV pilus assembly protein PilQ
MRYGIIGFVALLALVVTEASLLAATATIGSIKVAPGGSRIEIQGDQPLTYLYRKMTGGSGIMLDIAPGKTRGIVGEIPGAGLVTGIWVKELQVDGIPVTRLVIGMEKEVAVNVSRDAADAGRLVITFPSLASPDAAMPGDPSLNDLLEPQKKAVAEQPPVKADSPIAPKLAAKPAASPIAAEIAEAEPETKKAVAPVPVAVPAPVVVPKLDSAAGKPTSTSVAGQQLESVVIGNEAVEIISGTAIANYDAFKLSGPERLVVDIPGAATALKSREIKVGKFGVARLRIGVYPDKTRLVFDAADAKVGLPLHIIQKTAKGLKITFAAGKTKR